MDKIPCDGCLCLPTCVNKFSTNSIYPSRSFTFNYYFDETPLTYRCLLITMYMDNHKRFQDIKYFYLKLKGLIK